MKGNLYRPWPENENIPLLNCTFKPGKDDRDFFVQTEVKAKNEEEAKIMGKDECKDAVNIFKLCINEEVFLDINRNVIKNKKEPLTHGTADLLGKVTIIRDSPVSSEQLNEIAKAQKVINNSVDKYEILKKSIHWWAKGKKESDTIDCFIKLWISLEILVEGKGKRHVIVYHTLSTLFLSISQLFIRNLTWNLLTENHVLTFT